MPFSVREAWRKDVEAHPLDPPPSPAVTPVQEPPSPSVLEQRTQSAKEEGNEFVFQRDKPAADFEHEFLENFPDIIRMGNRCVMPARPERGVFCATADVRCDECGAAFFEKDDLGTDYYIDACCHVF
jgi:hypothetical protein